MKTLLDLFPAAAFFAAYLVGRAVGGDEAIYIATGVLIASLIGVVLVYRFAYRRWHRAHLWVTAIAIVLGGLTIYLHDPRFIKLKPTLVYGAFCVALLASHLVGERVLLARIPQTAIAMPDAAWRKVNFAWAVFFGGCAALNLYVASHFAEATWVKFKFIGFTLLPMLFALAQLPFLARYLTAAEEK